VRIGLRRPSESRRPQAVLQRHQQRSLAVQESDRREQPELEWRHDQRLASGALRRSRYPRTERRAAIGSRATVPRIFTAPASRFPPGQCRLNHRCCAAHPDVYEDRAPGTVALARTALYIHRYAWSTWMGRCRGYCRERIGGPVNRHREVNRGAVSATRPGVR